MKKIIAIVLKKKYYDCKFIEIKHKIRSARKSALPIIFLLGTATHSNIGDQAIGYAEIEAMN